MPRLNTFASESRLPHRSTAVAEIPLYPRVPHRCAGSACGLAGGDEHDSRLTETDDVCGAAEDVVRVGGRVL